MPGLPGFQRDVEASSSVGIDGRVAVPLASIDNHFTAEVSVAIGGSEYFALRGPRGSDAATSDNVLSLHFENVGEIGGNCDLQG